MGTKEVKDTVNEHERRILSSGTGTPYPKWLIESLDDITDSREWNGFIGELEDAIEQQLVENHVQTFADLSEPEKELFLERAVQTLAGTTSHQVVSREVAQILDKHINGQVARDIGYGRSPFITRTELLLSSSQEAIVGILERWPELRYKLVRFLNQPLPGYMRHHVWKAFLKNDQVLGSYQEMLSSNPRGAISPQDKQISERTEELLNNEPSFSDMKGSVGCFYAMKAVLSYHHALKHDKKRLTDTEMLLIGPFIAVISDKISRREPATIKVLEVLVQEYMTLIKVRPTYMVDENAGEELRRFSQQVISYVTKMDPGLTQAFMDAFAPSPANIIATETKMFEVLGDAMAALIRPIIKPFFVGILNMETLLFVWDQFMIGLDAPGFTDLFLPVITACFLVLLGTRLTASDNLQLHESVILREGYKLKPADFQYLINQHFYLDFFRLIAQEKLAPTLDPTQKPMDPRRVPEGNRPHWQAWYTDIDAPQRTQPSIRDQFRVLREEERLRMLALERERGEETAKIAALEEMLRNAEEARDQGTKAERERADRETERMAKELAEEKKAKADAEIWHEREMKKLKEELDILHSQPPGEQPSGYPMHFARPPTRSGSGASAGSLYIFPPPPCTPASRLDSVPEAVPVRTSGPSSSDGQGAAPRGQVGSGMAKEAVEEIMRLAMAAANKINEGEGASRDKLNKFTRQCMAAFDEDKSEAEIELFGRRLEPDELEQMDEENRAYYTEKISEGIVARSNARRQLELQERVAPPL